MGQRPARWPDWPALSVSWLHGLGPVSAWPQSLGPVSQAIGLARHLLGASHYAARQPLALCASLLYSSCPLVRPAPPREGPGGDPRHTLRGEVAGEPL
eukprot:SM000284S10678  [mRNA]  locus=s284:105383:105749:- [translate_table: standard]